MKVLRTFIGVVALALVLGAPGLAGIVIKGVDLSAYPTVRATVVADRAGSETPTLTENGRATAGFRALNLGQGRSVVVAIDRSQSMQGPPFADAVAAARSFIGGKSTEDRVQVVAFGSGAQSLTSFSNSTIDADAALRNLSVDSEKGTALYDAVALAASSAAAESLPARVLILLTDGEDASSKTSLEDAVSAANDAGMSIYAIGIAGRGFDPAVLARLAGPTGGSYHAIASSDALVRAYASIADELRRTWQVEYVTSARPGDRVDLRATIADQESVVSRTRIPGSSLKVPRSAPSPLLPDVLLESRFGPLLVGLAVGAILLLAAAIAFAGKKGAWLSRRLEPHIGEARHVDVAGGERLAAAAGLFLATERTFGHLRPWRHVTGLLERADLPLRSVEFFYATGIAGLLVGMGAAAFSPPTVLVLAGLAGGAAIPYAVVAYKARHRLKAFENQLPDLLITMAASLKAGHSFRQGMQAVIDEDQEPAAKEFKRVLAETRLGRPMDAALAEMASRIGSKDFEFVITAVAIQRQVGGSLASLFDLVADTVRDRQQFGRKIKGLTAMGRMSAYVLIGLPFFVLAVITLVNSEYMSPLWHSSTGHKLLVAMLVMMAVGSLVLKKIVSFRG